MRCRFTRRSICFDFRSKVTLQIHYLASRLARPLNTRFHPRKSRKARIKSLTQGIYSLSLFHSGNHWTPILVPTFDWIQGTIFLVIVPQLPQCKIEEFTQETGYCGQFSAVNHSEIGPRRRPLLKKVNQDIMLGCLDWIFNITTGYNLLYPFVKVWAF